MEERASDFMKSLGSTLVTRSWQLGGHSGWDIYSVSIGEQVSRVRMGHCSTKKGKVEDQG